MITYVATDSSRYRIRYRNMVSAPEVKNQCMCTTNMQIKWGTWGKLLQVSVYLIYVLPTALYDAARLNPISSMDNTNVMHYELQ